MGENRSTAHGHHEKSFETSAKRQNPISNAKKAAAF
jgi:hypothetical protein